jgi:hypothetical protein
MTFRMQTIAENSARIALDRTTITLRLPELEYLLLNLSTLANQLAWYKLAEADVTSYMQCHGSNSLHSSYRISVSLCAI